MGEAGRGETPARLPGEDDADARRAAADREIPLNLVTEQVLLSALREQDATAAADAARRRAEFLADAGLRLGASLDQELTYSAIAGLPLPGLDAWCVVDVVEASGGLRRIAVVHPDEGKQVVARSLVRRWLPAVDDPIGVPAVTRARGPVLITDRADEAIVAAARDPDTLRVLRWLGAGSLLVVPIVAHDVLLGAITYVSRPGAQVYTPEDVRLAEALAARCAQALEAARLYGAARAARAEADAARAEANSARTEAEAARASAEAANASKAQFLRTISHELRMPLNTIGGYADLLEMGIRGLLTGQQRAEFARVQASQRHLLGLVNQVLDFAQLETGPVHYDIVEVPVGDALAGARDLIDPQARAKGLTLSVDEPAPAVAVRADAAKLRRVLLNLLGNAVTFTDAGGRIRLACTASEETVALSVEDTGIGIAADSLERVFEPFVRLDLRHTRSHDGVGLGLSISRGLARGMGGELTAKSTPGVGSTFTLTLPRA